LNNSVAFQIFAIRKQNGGQRRGLHYDATIELSSRQQDLQLMTDN